MDHVFCQVGNGKLAEFGYQKEIKNLSNLFLINTFR